MNLSIGIIGLGYVGLPLAVLFNKYGFNVVGYDISAKVVLSLIEGKSHIEDVSDGYIKDFLANKENTFSTNPQYLSNCDVLAFCVPTPLCKNKKPNLKPIESALAVVSEFANSNALVVIESTVNAGFCEYASQKYFPKNPFAFSPERIDPVNTRYNLDEIPKVAGFKNKNSERIFMQTYGKVFNIHIANSMQDAELCKLYENTYRAVNLALANEFESICKSLGSDVHSVIKAASTKPFGFQAFYPSVGVGGHCIPVDPHYLLLSYESDFIRKALDINADKPHMCRNALPENINGKSIALLGLAYKPNVGDCRESPAIELFEILEQEGASMHYLDPHVPVFKSSSGKEYTSLDSSRDDFFSFLCSQYVDYILLCVPHSALELKGIAKLSNVFDFCGALTEL